MQPIRSKEVGYVTVFKFSNQPTDELNSCIVGCLLEQLIIIQPVKQFLALYNPKAHCHVHKRPHWALYSYIASPLHTFTTNYSEILSYWIQLYVRQLLCGQFLKQFYSDINFYITLPSRTMPVKQFLSLGFTIKIVYAFHIFSACYIYRLSLPSLLNRHNKIR
jgi:hypothetical protein